MTAPAPSWLESFESNLYMYLLARFGDHRSYRNGDINSYINSYMDTLEIAALTVLICHIGRFLKSGIPVYNFEALDTACRKTRRWRTRRKGRITQAIAKRYTFYGSAKTYFTKGVFMWILRNFSKHLFYRTHLGDCFRRIIESDRMYEI